MGSKSIALALKEDIKSEITAIEQFQLDRAKAIEEPLKQFLKKKKPIRDYREFIAVSEHQRRCAGIADKTKVEHSGGVTHQLAPEEREILKGAAKAIADGYRNNGKKR